MEAERVFEIQQTEKQCKERVQEIESNLRRAESQLHFKTRTLAEEIAEKNRLVSSLKKLRKGEDNNTIIATPSIDSSISSENVVKKKMCPTPYDVLNANDALSTLLEHFRKDGSSRSYNKLLKWTHDSRRETGHKILSNRLCETLCEYVRDAIFDEREEFRISSSSSLTVILTALSVLRRCIALSNTTSTRMDNNVSTRIRVQDSSTLSNSTRLREALKQHMYDDDDNNNIDTPQSCMSFILKSLRLMLPSQQENEKESNLKTRIDLSIAFVNVCFETVSLSSCTIREKEETVFVLSEQLKFWSNVKKTCVLKCRIVQTLYRLCENHSRISKYIVSNSTDILSTLIRMFLSKKDNEEDDEERNRMELQIVRLLFSFLIDRKLEFLKFLHRSSQVANESLTELLSRVPEISHGRSRSWLVPKLVLVLIRASSHVSKSRTASILVRETITFLSGICASYPRFVNELVVSGLRFKLLSVLLSIHRKQLRFKIDKKNMETLRSMSYGLMMDVGVVR